MERSQTARLLAAAAAFTPSIPADDDRAVTAWHAIIGDLDYGAAARAVQAYYRDNRQVAERMVRMVTESRVTAIDGTELTMQADSICVHGDSAGAVEMARSTKELLKAHGVTIAPFAS